MKMKELIQRAREIIKKQGCKPLFVKGIKFFVKEIEFMLGIIFDSPPLAHLRVLCATKILKKSITTLDDNVDNWINYTYGFRVAGISIRPSQVPYEISRLLEIVKELKPKTLLEIGTARGGTLFLFCITADPEATIISIDLPRGPFGGGYPSWKTPLYKAFASSKKDIYLMRTNSHDLGTLQEVKKVLNGRELDFLFIDGDHRYEGVKRDFEMYLPLVRKGGIIALHDIVEHRPERGCEVSRFWNEIKHSYKHLEIVRDRNQKWAGIGVLYV